jgi:NAD(P)-dependent dehydrogenase (short-subunit alcohol dehydrogenase family)
MSGALENKSVVIIGGSSGLGLSAAQACVREGASVVIVGREALKVRTAVRELGGAAVGLVGDACKPQTAVKAIKLSLRKFGDFHGLYHVAGGSGRRRGDGPVHQITDEGWEYTLRLNLTSVFHSNRAAIAQFVKQGRGGTVLNMSSVLGWAPSPGHFATHAYAAAKSAIIGMSQAAASFYAPQNIRLNVIAPGLIATPMSTRAQSDLAILKFMKSKQPLDGGRMGRTGDLDAAVLYFLSDASKFVTGQVLAVDGGWCVSEGQLG